MTNEIYKALKNNIGSISFVLILLRLDGISLGESSKFIEERRRETMKKICVAYNEQQ